MKEPHPRSWLIRYVIGVFSLLLCSVLTKFSVEGKKNLPPSGPYILAPNHIDDVDPAPITAAVVKPITYLMAEDQIELPWYKAWGPRSYGVTLVNRSNLQISTIKNIQKQMSHASFSGCKARFFLARVMGGFREAPGRPPGSIFD